VLVEIVIVETRRVVGLAVHSDELCHALASRLSEPMQ
jgi:hypothetical protein